MSNESNESNEKKYITMKDGSQVSLYDTVCIEKIPGKGPGKSDSKIFSPEKQRRKEMREKYSNCSLKELEYQIKIHYKFSHKDELKKMYNEKLNKTKH